MFCESCGVENKAESKFCVNCGKSLYSKSASGNRYNKSQKISPAEVVLFLLSVFLICLAIYRIFFTVFSFGNMKSNLQYSLDDITNLSGMGHDFLFIFFSVHNAIIAIPLVIVSIVSGGKALSRRHPEDCLSAGNGVIVLSSVYIFFEFIKYVVIFGISGESFVSVIEKIASATPEKVMADVVTLCSAIVYRIFAGRVCTIKEA